MFCPRCGRPVAPEAAFCSSCGLALRAVASDALAGEAAAALESSLVTSGPVAPSAYAVAPVVITVPATVVLPRSAGFWIRTVAYVIDAIVLLPVTWTIDRILEVDTATPFSPAFVAAACFQAIAWLVYSVLLESSDWQGTVGKLALGLRVTDKDGHRISIGRATGRHFAKYVSLILLGIGFLMIVVQEQKRGLHDLIAGTLVVRGRRGP